MIGLGSDKKDQLAPSPFTTRVILDWFAICADLFLWQLKDHYLKIEFAGGFF